MKEKWNLKPEHRNEHFILFIGWKCVLSVLTLMQESEFTQENLSMKLKEMCSTENIPYVALMRSLRVVITGQKVVLYFWIN